jgi:glyoxylase-like metal-dependent hydrolase (beta-lactamase superfamily II)
MFTRISVPTPFQIGRVNAYLAGRTLIDPGPDSEEAWATLLNHIEGEGLRPGDIERVVVTHPHPDHFGLAHRFRAEGARVLASTEGAAIMRDFSGRLDYEQSFFTPFFQRCGLAAETARTVTQLPESFLAFAPDVETDRELEDGDEITIHETRFAVDAVRGHTTGELLFAYSNEGEYRAVVGDHVLPTITPNPFLQPPPDRSDERPRILPAYNRSLKRLREEDFDLMLPGHGGLVREPSDRINEILAAHEERTDQVRDIVDGPTTPVEVMKTLFDDLPVTEQFSGLSEAVGHLDVLEARGEVRQRDSGDLIVYEPN